MQKSNYFLLLILFAVVLSIQSVSADSYELRCLTRGQSLNFRQLCNPSMSIIRGPTNICVHILNNGKICPAPLNACNNQGLSCSAISSPGEPGGTPPTNTTLPPTAPEITLVQPANSLSLQQPTQINFIFKVSKSYTISSCRLKIDETTVSSTSSITSSQITMSYFINQGQHSWKISCTTRTGAFPQVFEVNSETRTLTVGQQIPPANQNNSTNSTNQTTTQNNFEINLLQPENNLALTGSQDVTFKFGFSANVQRSSLNSCSLILNSVPSAYNINSFYSTNTTTLPQTFEITKTLSPSTYSWKIECTSPIKTHKSETRTLTINEPEQETNTGSSSSGNENEGNENSDTPAQTAPKTAQKNSRQKTENNFEQLVGKSPENSTQVSKEENAKITGAVIGNVLMSKTGATLTSAMLTLILVVLVIYSKKVGKKKRR